MSIHRSNTSLLLVGSLTHVVIPLEENRAISSSKLIPPTPITSIISAGLFKVLVCGKVGVITCSRHIMWLSYSPIQRAIIANGRDHNHIVGSQLPNLEGVDKPLWLV